MRERSKWRVATLLTALLLASAPATAQKDSGQFPIPGPDYGVALTPAVYFVNFLLMYWSNPDTAANMPAYRAPIPPEFADCLLENPEGCRYADYQQYFNGRTFCRDGNRGDTCRWTSVCESEPSVQQLAPPEFNNAHQLNEPLGRTHAARLARALGIDEASVLTADEYQCLIGTPGQRIRAQDTIVACIPELTNSTGAATIPLSSYGLAFVDPQQPLGEAVVRSACAPHAPCLRMNNVLAGPLEELARQCGFADKLASLFTRTPIMRFAVRGNMCQSSSIASSSSACLAESVRLR